MRREDLCIVTFCNGFGVAEAAGLSIFHCCYIADKKLIARW